MTTAKRSSRKTKASVVEVAASEPVFRSREERVNAGRLLRDTVPRASHAAWKLPAKHRDPIAILEQSNEDRLPELIPIRYGRMLRSPFTFFRGSAALMAYDLATTPSTGIRVQACGDCHLLNFGLFATPERHLVFDLNDFDETLPAPWEWDIKRLAASFAIAARDSGASDARSRGAAVDCVRSYRERLREFSKMSPLEVWYANLDVDSVIARTTDKELKRARQEMANKARQRVAENLFPKIVQQVGGHPRIVDQPPFIFHVADPEFMDKVREGLEDYRASLSDERRVLLDRYRLVDAAIKVVGIGSVGTRCLIGLFFSEENHPLILQFKESCRSVLEPYAGKSCYENQGERVVMGQRLMQSSSDIFLGWTRGRAGRDFFVRQLRDMKVSVPVEKVTPQQLRHYAGVCGLTLARAHAKSGDAATISGYLGKSDTFDEALGDFALAYANQTEQDHAVLVKAVNAGKLEVLVEDE
ncbi:DUF2252 domain-containing protein [Pseudomonas sp. N040]|uniref:DUF2252 domain-containing protein n=1 Tax=Pseudomonas sp. N040 TaxID=2785325 RepID=UPI0018A279C3|nr:DUF2252 domain-containing protein [Pseudomonas sp. N040]MBF7729211.1 DUF2252 domain-containing protein [Pseudomonas sp. N040]MBW7012851.1 DUF2252 domain-containing protein [Pseudomonas sp. N040]